MLVVDGTSKIVDKLAVSSGDDVDESEGVLIEGCRSFVAVPARLNNLEKVSVACTTAASALARFVPLPVPDCSDPVTVDRVVVRATGVERLWLDVLIEKTTVLLAAKSSVSGVAVITEDVAAKIDVCGLAAIEGVGKEDIGMSVEGWMSARFEAISVWLRKRAAL